MDELHLHFPVPRRVDRLQLLARVVRHALASPQLPGGGAPRRRGCRARAPEGLTVPERRVVLVERSGHVLVCVRPGGRHGALDLVRPSPTSPSSATASQGWYEIERVRGAGSRADASGGWPAAVALPHPAGRLRT